MNRMKLRPDPFNRICSGEKTIEYRLHDEKRSLLNKGDYIRFTEIADEERTVLVEMVDILTAPSFVALEHKLIGTGVQDGYSERRDGCQSGTSEADRALGAECEDGCRS